jgi:hypothetical protein
MLRNGVKMNICNYKRPISILNAKNGEMEYKVEHAIPVVLSGAATVNACNYKVCAERIRYI